MKDKSLRVLIVEDSKNYLWVISQELYNGGLIVVTAENGEEGLAVAQKEKPDLILLDIEMPKMDGITMAKKLKELKINTPIIFLTNIGDLKHISRAMEISNDYLVKSDADSRDILAMVKEKLRIK